ncbi:MAG: VWA domain-containing protein [Acidobacteria bacterium]|nr:VWA domain-containing protein [Acidobacteriota bacterium]
MRFTSRLVQVNVVVQDKKGEPVSDLTKDDFAVLDQGQSQQLSLFAVESNQILPAAPRAGKNVYTNRLEQRGATPTSVTVVLIDTLNTRLEQMANVRPRLVEFLGQLQPQDRVALYALGHHLHILHEFTNDATALLRALGRYQAGPPFEHSASQPPDFDPTGLDTLDATLAEVNKRQGDFYMVNRVLHTTEALEAIANHLALVPGRKNLVWLSAGFPFSLNLDRLTLHESSERRSFDEEIQRAVRALNKANLAVYPVDARGLLAPASVQTEFHAAQQEGSTAARLPEPMLSLTSDVAKLETMDVFAERTGGRVFHNANDIRGSIRRAIDDSRLTYVLGFYPSHEKWDGKFHEIKVQVKRPGLRVRHRKGYFALADPVLDAKQRRELLREAAINPLEATGLGLSVRVTPVDVPGARAVKLDLRIEPKEVTLEQKEGTWLGSIDLVFAQAAGDGTIVTGESQTYELRLTQQTYEAANRIGLVLSRRLSLADKTAQLRVVVGDNPTGAVGSVTISLSRVFSTGGN